MNCAIAENWLRLAKHFEEINLTGKEEFQKAVFQAAGQEFPKKVIPRDSSSADVYFT